MFKILKDTLNSEESIKNFKLAIETNIRSKVFKIITDCRKDF